MPSIFDTPELNARLFFPRPDTSTPPPGALDTLIEVAPGVRLHLRTHPAPAARVVVLLFHGNGEVVADYDAAAPHFAAAGARLAVVDYRGYGRSEGTPMLRTCLADAHLVARTVRAGASLPVVIMGRSLGSACAAELAAAFPAPAGVILESGFTDLRGFVLRRGLTVEGSFTPDDVTVFDPIHKLRACSAPVLVLHGAMDRLIAPEEGQAAHDAVGATDKELVLIPGRGHNDVSFHPLYWEALRAFVARVGG